MWIVALGWLLPLASLRAEPASAQLRAAAESLFDEALLLLEQKQVAEACPKLEASQRLDPGVGTLLYLADCYRQLGRTASAWATFRDAAYQAEETRDERAAVAVQLADELKPELSYLTIQLAPEEQSEPELSHNGEVLVPALLGTAFPVDPGEYRVQVRAAGHSPQSNAFTVPTGPGRHTLDIPLLQILPPSNSRKSSPTDGSETGASPVLGWSLVAAGAAGAGLAGALTFLALDANRDANAQCRVNDASLCGAEGVSLGQTASSRATWAAVSAGVGLLALGTGVTLLILSPTSNSNSAGPRASLRAIHRAGVTQLQWRSTW